MNQIDKHEQQVCPYNKCDGSGLLPFKGKDGKVRKDVHLFCDCHPDYGVDVREHYREVRPEDYDYPMSEDFRAWTYQYCGVLDPGYISPSPDLNVIDYLPEEPWDRKQWDVVQQLRAQVIFLQNKINEHVDKSKKKQGKY